MDYFFTQFLKEIKSPRVDTLFENIFVKIYLKHFTLKEARALSQFYSAPPGKKDNKGNATYAAGKPGGMR